MCGIAGFTLFRHPPPDPAALLARMGHIIAPRGPDGAGSRLAPPIALAHRRLAVRDLRGGAQPMASADLGQWLVFNGEIYNPDELPRPPGALAEGPSDTARLLEALVVDPLAVLPRLDGMFAFAFWNTRTRELLLARDRFGIKPLFYTLRDGELVFASDARAVRLHPRVSGDLDPASVAACFALGHVPAPASICRDVRKLPPGHFLLFGPEGRPRLAPFGALPAPDAESPPPAECAAIIRNRLRLAVRRQLRAEVPVGLLLSGGLDSSSLAVLAAQESSVPLHSFSLGFPESSFDESPHARFIADFCGFTHHHAVLTADQAAASLPDAVACLDEPLFDPSLLPTFALMRFVRPDAKVVLGGEGGDELFGGYPAFQAHRLAEGLARLPAPVWNAIARWARRRPASARYASFPALLSLFLQHRSLPPASRFLAWMGLPGPTVAPLLAPALRETLPPAPDDGFLDLQALPSSDAFERLRLAALRRYLQDHVLAKVDRASMAHGLEVRVPFLDARLADFALRQPMARHVDLFRTKRLLKDAMRGLVPDRIRHRRKAGFMFPLAAWLNGPLRPLLLDTCAPGRLARQGLFDPAHVRMLLDDHFARRADHGRRLWALLVFQLWLAQHESRTV